MSRRRDYLVNVLAQGGGYALSMGASFVAFALLARVLSTEVFGQYAFVLAFVTTAATLADLGTNAAMARGISAARDDDPGAYFGNFLLLRLALGAGVTLLAVPVALVIKPEIRHPLLVACALIPFAAARFFEPIYQVFGRARYALYASATLGVTRLVLAVVLLLGLGVGLTGYVYGYAAAQILFVGVGFVLAARLVRPRLNFERARMMAVVAIAAPMGVAEIFNALYARADVIMLSYLRSSAEAGLYNAAFRLLDLAVIVTAAVATPLVPILTRLLHEDLAAARRACSRMTEIALVATLPLPMIAGYVAEPLMIAIYGPQFAPSAALLPIFAWLFLLTGWFMLGSSINLAAGKVSHGYWSSAVTALLNISLNWLLIPEYGITGAAWATVASIVFKLVVSQVYVVRSVGNVYPAGRWLRIATAAITLQGCLHLTVGEQVIAPVIFSLAVYVTVLRVLGIARAA